MQPLKLGTHTAPLPLVQGGMGIGVSLSKLASSVANEGGIGVLSAAGLGMLYKGSPHYEENARDGLRQEIRKTRALSSGVLGVNIMVAMTNFADLVEVAIEEEIDVIFAGAGLPLDLPKHLPKNHKTKLVPIVSSARAARIILKKWLQNYDYLPDGFVLEGPLAGGHLGFKKEQIADPSFTLETLLAEVLTVLRPFEEERKQAIPVIVAGGIYTGEDIFRFLQRGAAAVQMATRFVTTHECDADDAFKASYIQANADDIVIIDSPVGLPGRAIDNAYLEDVRQGLKHPFTCPYDCIITCKKEAAPYCITLALLQARKGNFKHGFAFAGANAYRATEVISVKTLIETLKDEYAVAAQSSDPS
ncbi:MAG: nitronate monooxygenase [Acholeplasmatales bacterium]|nr:MAG: nitronate monooxygenase [Acholeplasmatales bacterium]